jgi:short-subunit dehydrogenase
MKKKKALRSKKNNQIKKVRKANLYNDARSKASKYEKINGYCLITGGSNGIGKAMVLELASKGIASVVISNQLNELKSLQKTIISKYHVNCQILCKDLLNFNSYFEIYDYCKNNNFNIQILINNVGIGFYKPFQKTSINFDSNLVKLNIMPMIQLTKLFIPELKKFNQSFILNMSSLGSYRPMPYKALYVASKSFIYSFSKSISEELKSESIQVSVVCPAGVHTNSDVIKRINSNGKIAKWTSLYVDIVASYIIKSMFKTKNVIIPGFGAKILLIIIQILPEPITRWIFGRKKKED